ncbi:uncharacterized protein VTP21DRAFT_9807 [Calcarisporiella thermophila]|uniref:uncharacterized protein n=1 Tax=Calcarisporiella thermophila TaxID=911321 RepID=UPI0037446A2E
MGKRKDTSNATLTNDNVSMHAVNDGTSVIPPLMGDVDGDHLDGKSRVNQELELLRLRKQNQKESDPTIDLLKKIKSKPLKTRAKKRKEKQIERALQNMDKEDEKIERAEERRKRRKERRTVWE